MQGHASQLSLGNATHAFAHMALSSFFSSNGSSSTQNMWHRHHEFFILAIL